MYRFIRSFQHLAIISLVVLIIACQQTVKPLPTEAPLFSPAQDSVAAAPEEEPESNILPFPEHFSLARQDLWDFEGTVDVKDFFKGQKTPTQGLSVLPVLSSRFGCYTFGSTEPWDGGDSGNCLYSQSFFGADTFVYKGYILAIHHDQSAFMRPAISVWKTRGDSLDFYTILDKCFEPENEGCKMQIDSLLPISANKHRLFGQISWDSMPSHRAVRAWSAVWTFPNRLDFQ